MLIEGAILVLICLFILFKFILKKSPRRIRFVGGRGTGKTLLLNFITSNSYKTVPTLERYTVRYRNCILEEVPERDGDLMAKYSIDDPNLEYYFFVKDFEDYKALNQLFKDKNYNLKFVIVEGTPAKKQDDLISMNGNFELFKKIL